MKSKDSFFSLLTTQTTSRNVKRFPMSTQRPQTTAHPVTEGLQIPWKLERVAWKRRRKQCNAKTKAKNGKYEGIRFWRKNVKTFLNIYISKCFVQIVKLFRWFRWFRFGGFAGFVPVFRWFRRFRWFRWFRSDGFVSVFRVLVHAECVCNLGKMRTTNLT